MRSSKYFEFSFSNEFILIIFSFGNKILNEYNLISCVLSYDNMLSYRLSKDSLIRHHI